MELVGLENTQISTDLSNISLPVMMNFFKGR